MRFWLFILLSTVLRGRGYAPRCPALSFAEECRRVDAPRCPALSFAEECLRVDAPRCSALSFEHSCSSLPLGRAPGPQPQLQNSPSCAAPPGVTSRALNGLSDVRRSSLSTRINSCADGGLRRRSLTASRRSHQIVPLRSLFSSEGSACANLQIGPNHWRVPRRRGW